MYGAGVVIGIGGPREVDACSVWEFFAAHEGWRKANSPDEGPKPPTPEEHDAMMEKYR